MLAPKWVFSDSAPDLSGFFITHKLPTKIFSLGIGHTLLTGRITGYYYVIR
jgi:hypothetical protein